MQHRRRKALFVVGALVVALVNITATALGGAAPASAAGPGAGGEYHPLAPARIFDTRSPGINTAPGAINTSAAGGTRDVTVLGRGGIPTTANHVLAVAVTITVTSPTREGYLQVYPTGAAAGISSVLNFNAGQTVPNLTILTVGNGGQITVKLVTGSPGTAEVFVDVFGWFSTSDYPTNGARMIPVGPARIFDSREPSFNGTGAPLGERTTVTVQARGADSQNPNITDVVPNSNDVVGIVLNVTGINDLAGSSTTFVSVLPENPPTPVTTSNLNLSPGQIKANLVIVPVTNADGKIRLYNHAGNTHLAVDVVGYMLQNQDPNTQLGRVIPLTSPFRSLDTREPSFGNVPLGPAQTESWSFSQFVNSVTLLGQPVGNQIALFGNLTGTGLTLTPATPTAPVSTFFTVFPSDTERPFASNINVTTGANVPNMALVKLGADDGIKAYNHAGYLHYIFDVSAVVLDN